MVSPGPHPPLSNLRLRSEVGAAVALEMKSKSAVTSVSVCLIMVEIVLSALVLVSLV